MHRIIQALALAAILWIPIFGGTFEAKATHTAIVASTFTAVGTSSSLGTNAVAGATVHVHVNGTYDVTLNLQREVGSPGSGAFETVQRDIAPAANGLHRIVWTTEKDNEVLRLQVSTYTSGTVVYALFDGRTSPRANPSRATHLNRFDDFNENDLAVLGDTTWQTEWLAFINSDVGGSGGSSYERTANINEGAVEGTAGTSGRTESVSAFSYTVVTNDAGVVSDGLMVIEYRVYVDDITEAVAYAGLSDTIVVDAAIIPFNVDSNVVTDTGSTNDIGFFFSADATDTNSWQPVSANAGAVGNNADEFACDFRNVVNTTYDVLRLEIEATGDAFWYVNGTLCAAEALAVAAASILVPYIAVTEGTDDATGGGIFTVDYVDFYFNRPD